jgi:hypothetical protein
MTRPIFPLLILAAVLNTGCRYGEVLAFGGGGKAPSRDTGNTGGNGNPTDDTGMPMDDTAMGPLGSPPSVLNISTTVEDYPDISWVVEVTLTYTDPDGDVDGGSVELLAAIDGQDPMDITVPIDGSQAINDQEAGTVFLAFAVGGGDISGNLSVSLVDAAGLMSEPYDQPL